MATMGTIPGAGITGWFGHAGNGFATALGKKDGDLASGMLPAAKRTRDGRVGFAHRADRLEDFFAILADIFVNWHRHLFIFFTLAKFYL
jgi:hypothetical protein